MGNTGGRERAQPPVDDSGPTVLQTRINYAGRANDGDASFGSRVWWLQQTMISFQNILYKLTVGLQFVLQLIEQHCPTYYHLF